MADCPNCPGGANLVFRLNPDADAVDIVREENVVLYPQRLDPARVGIDQLLGMREITSLLNGRDYVLRWEDTRTFDDDGDVIDGDCGFNIVEPEGCGQSVYDPGLRTEPAITGNERDGTLGVSSVSGCATHIFCGDGWLCLQGQASPMPDERVCYPDMSGQNYGGNVGAWFVFGENQMDRFPCTPLLQTWCVDEVEVATTEGPDLSPAGGFGALTWVNDPNNLPDNVFTSETCTARITNQSTQDLRFRVEFFTPPGNQCPLELSWDSAQSQEYFVGAWDSVSNTLLDATVMSEGAGNARIVSADSGDLVGVQSETTTRFTVRFDCDGTVDAGNVRILFLNTGIESSAPFDSGKRITQMRLTSFQPQNGCNTWGTLQAQQAFMDQVDPTGPGWQIINGELCKIVAPGRAAAYGQLAGSESTSNPTVDEVPIPS